MDYQSRDIRASTDVSDENYLMHYGIEGMKWGVRRYQNYDGSLKSAGRLKYSEKLKNRSNEYKKMARKAETDEEKAKLNAKAQRLANRSERQKAIYEKKYAKAYVKDLNKAYKEYNKAADNASGALVSGINSISKEGFKKGEFTTIGSLAKLVGGGVEAINARMNYDQIKNRALNEIPKYTNYEIEKTSKGYKLVDKGSFKGADSIAAVKDGGLGKLKSGTEINKRGIVADAATKAIRTGLELYDAAKVNKSSVPTKSDNTAGSFKVKRTASTSKTAEPQQFTPMDSSKALKANSKWDDIKTATKAGYALIDASVKAGKDKANISPLESGLRKAGEAAKGIGDLSSAIKTRNATIESNKEAKVNNLPEVKRDKLGEVLSIVSPAITVATAIASIASTANDVRKKTKE